MTGKDREPRAADRWHPRPGADTLLRPAYPHVAVQDEGPAGQLYAPLAGPPGRPGQCAGAWGTGVVPT